MGEAGGGKGAEWLSGPHVSYVCTACTTLYYAHRSRLKIYMYELPWTVSFPYDYGDAAFGRDNMCVLSLSKSTCVFMSCACATRVTAALRATWRCHNLTEKNEKIRRCPRLS